MIDLESCLTDAGISDLDIFDTRVCEKDLEGNFLDCNPPARRDLGEWQCDSDAFEHSCLQQCEERERHVIDSARPVTHSLERWKFKHSDQDAWVDVSRFPKFDGANLVGIIVVWRVATNVVASVFGQLGISTDADSDVFEDETDPVGALARGRRALRAANDGMWDRRVGSDTLFVSQRWCDTLGIPRVRSIDRSEWEARIHPHDRASVLKTAQEYLANPAGEYICEYRLQHEEGHYVWILARGTATLNQANEPVHFSGSHTDVTERKSLSHFLEKVLNTNTSMIYVKDRERRFTFANAALAEFYGEESSEIIGKADSDFSPTPSELESFRIADEQILSGDKEIVERIEGITGSDKKRRFFKTTKVQFPQTSGGHYLLGVSTDITPTYEAQRDVEREREKLKKIMELAPCAIYLKDRDLRYTMANRGLLAKVGRDKFSEVEGKSTFDLFPSDVATVIDAHDREVLSGSREFKDELFTIDDSHGNPRLFESTKVAFRDADNQIVGIVGVSNDVTEARRQRENELRLGGIETMVTSLKHDFLYRLLGGFEVELRKIPSAQNGEVDISERRDEWIAMLTFLKAYIEKLQHWLPSPETPEKIGSEISSFSLRDAVQQVIGWADQYVEEPSVVNKIDPTLTVSADKTLVQLLVFNYISNAKRFTPDANAKEPVFVETNQAQGSTEGIMLSVDDAGFGLPSDQSEIKNLFELGVTKPMPAVDVHGSGFGLYLCKLIALAHDGFTSATHSERGGAQFNFFLPTNNGQ